VTSSLRRLGTLVAIGAIAIASFAYATGSSGMGLVAVPPVSVVTAPGGGSMTLMNNGNQPVIVGGITPDASCDPGITVPATGFTVGSGSGRSIAITCAAAGAFSGLRRCTFHANNAANVSLADFEVVCQYSSMANLSPDMGPIDFGSVSVGSTVTKTVHFGNPSPTTIAELFFQSTDPIDDFLIGAPCNPHARECDAPIAPVAMGGSGSFDVACSPHSVGPLSAQLFVDTDTHQRLTAPIQLTCTGASNSDPVISVTPSSPDAGPIEVLGAMGSGDLAITNAGGGTLQITQIQIVDTGTGAALDWTSTASNQCTGTPCDLAGTQELDLHVVFDPSAIGTRDASLVISYVDTAGRTLPIVLHGTGLGATLSLVGDNPSIDFGLVPIGTASPVTFQLANTGNRDLTDVALAVAPAGPPFSLSPAMTAMVSHTAPTTITATCMPTAAGMFTATFTAQAPDAFMSPPISITAKCEGSTQTLFSMPTTIALGEVRTGSSPLHIPVMALGAGVMIVSAQLDMPDANLALTVPPLPAPTPVALEVVVTPTTDGDLSDHVDVTAASGDSLHIPITGKVVTAAFAVPLTVSLGTFCVGQPTTGQTATLVSTGTATIELQAPTMAMASSPFQLQLSTPSSYPSALPAMATATVEVTPMPQTVAGPQMDDLVWTTDVTGNAMPHTTLTAVFVDDGGAIAPSAIGFGKVAVSHVDRPNGQRVTLQNCGTALVQLSSQLDSPFTIEGASVPTTLQPSESATISVGFHPQSAGLYAGNLTITIRDAAPLVVTLTGEGVIAASDGDAGLPTNEVPGTSFYACGCRSFDPAGAVPITLAVWLLCRRRRRTARIRW
jgi:hypothetical protein